MFTFGPWHFEDEDKGDWSVGIQASPPYIFADPQNDGNVIPICTLDEPARRAAREPVDDYDECIEHVGDYRANARLICAAPEMFAFLRKVAELGDAYLQIAARTIIKKVTEE